MSLENHVPIIIVNREMADRSVYIAAMAGMLHQRLADGFYNSNQTLKGEVEANLQTCKDKVDEANEELFDTIDILEQYA